MTDECQKSFDELKAYLVSSLLFSPSKQGEELYHIWSFPQQLLAHL